MTVKSNIQKEVQSFVGKALESVSVHKDSIDKRIESICEALRVITQEYTTEEYRFNLAMDFFVEDAYKDLSDCLAMILDSADLENDNSDVLFAVYYALSLARKKSGDIEGLRMLLGERYKDFSKYPLYYEVYSRYHKRVDGIKGMEFAKERMWTEEVAVSNPKRNRIIGR